MTYLAIILAIVGLSFIYLGPVYTKWQQRRGNPKFATHQQLKTANLLSSFIGLLIGIAAIIILAL